MTYRIHHTEAVVLGNRDVGEASRALFLLTKDLGLIRARAQGLRELKSKLRFSLQDFCRSRVDLVYGKNGWRVTSARYLESFTRPDINPRSRAAITRVAVLLRRLLEGEERQPALYSDVAAVFEKIGKTGNDRERVFCLEILLVIRLLAHLGYWGGDEAFLDVSRGSITDETIEKVNASRHLAIREINHALKETQL